MTHTLTIDDGGTPINLNDGTTTLLTAYNMAAPDVDENVIEAAQDGAYLSAPTWSNVKESIEVLLIGATPAAVRAKLQSIEALLDRARQQRRAWGGNRCFLNAQLGDEAASWRSEILAGKVTPVDPAADLWKKKMAVRIDLTRRYFWEGAREQLYLSSEDTAEVQGAVAIHNGPGAGQDNYIHIAATRATGVLPAPLELKLQYTGVGSANVDHLYLGNYVWMDPANILPVLTVNDNTTWATDGETQVHSSTLTKVLLQDGNGQYVRPIVGFSLVPSSGTYIRGRLSMTLGAATIPVYQNDAIRNGGMAAVDLGAMPLPPSGYAAAANAGTKFIVLMQRTGGDNETIHSICFLPSGHGLFRHMRTMMDIDLDPNDSVVDDGIEDVCYVLDAAGTNKYSLIKGYHAPIHVWPGRVNRLRLVVAGSAFVTGQPWSVSAWYRPRRLTL